MILDIASWALIVAGSLFVVAGGIGLVRMPDVYTRMHPAGMMDTSGAGLILIGLMLQAPDVLVAVKLALILFFLWFTSPTATHALARAARHAGIVPWRRSDEDGQR